MGKFDRCEICDYNVSTGSHFANAHPGGPTTVRWSSYAQEFLCSECAMAVIEANEELDIEEWLLNMDPVLADNQAMDTLNTQTDTDIATENVEEDTSPRLAEEKEQ